MLQGYENRYIVNVQWNSVSVTQITDCTVAYTNIRKYYNSICKYHYNNYLLFSTSFLQSSVSHDPSEIVLLCLSMLKTFVRLNLFSGNRDALFFRILCWVESSKEKHYKSFVEIYWNSNLLLSALITTDSSLLNKSMYFFHLLGNGNAGGLHFSVRAASKAAHITQQLINIDLLWCEKEQVFPRVKGECGSPSLSVWTLENTSHDSQFLQGFLPNPAYLASWKTLGAI